MQPPDVRLLDHADVAGYLLGSGLLKPSDIVDGNAQVVEVSRRNRDFRVTTTEGPRYFLKQGADVHGSATVRHEAMVYQLFHSSSSFPDLRACLPRYVEYDVGASLLVLDLLWPAEDLSTYHNRTGRYSTTFARWLGKALSILHRRGILAAKESASEVFRRRQPWALFLDKPNLAAMQSLSAANLQLISIVQSSPDFRRALHALRSDWRSDAVIHHDLKWDNCLLVRSTDSGRFSELRIVDWEFSDLGDPCWDAGGVLGNYLSSWLMSVPISGEEPPDRYLELASHPLSAMQPAIAAYWKAYVTGMALDGGTSQKWLMRAVPYAAVRLIQTGYEQMQHSMQLSGSVISMLQLSLNILQRPWEAAVHLLGLAEVNTA